MTQRIGIGRRVLMRWLRAVAQGSTMLGIAMIGLVWASIAFHLASERQSAEHAAVENASNLARAFEDEIKLLRDLVIMPLCPASRGDARFGKALVLDGRIRAIEYRTDSRAVFCDKWRLGREILDSHSL